MGVIDYFRPRNTTSRLIKWLRYLAWVVIGVSILLSISYGYLSTGLVQTKARSFQSINASWGGGRIVAMVHLRWNTDDGKNDVWNRIRLYFGWRDADQWIEPPRLLVLRPEFLYERSNSSHYVRIHVSLYPLTAVAIFVLVFFRRDRKRDSGSVE